MKPMCNRGGNCWCSRRVRRTWVGRRVALKGQQGTVRRLGAGGWTKQCCTEEGARKGEKGRGPRPHRGPTVGVHAQRRVTDASYSPPLHRPQMSPRAAPAHLPIPSLRKGNSAAVPLSRQCRQSTCGTARRVSLVRSGGGSSPMPA